MTNLAKLVNLPKDGAADAEEVGHTADVDAAVEDAVKSAIEDVLGGSVGVSVTSRADAEPEQAEPPDPGVPRYRYYGGTGANMRRREPRTD